MNLLALLYDICIGLIRCQSLISISNNFYILFINVFIICCMAVVRHALTRRSNGQDHTVMITVTFAWLLVAAVAVVLLLMELHVVWPLRFLVKCEAPACSAYITVHCNVCDSAGVMYWGDVDNSGIDKIETAYLDGTGRRTLLQESNAHYFAFVLHDGDIYFTDWNDLYVRVYFLLRQSW